MDARWRTFAAGVLCNLKAGTRAVFGLPLRAETFSLSLGQGVALFGIGVATSMALDYYAAPEPRIFELAAIQGEALSLMCVIGLAATCRLAAHPAPMGLLVAGLLSLRPALLLVAYGIDAVAAAGAEYVGEYAARGIANIVVAAILAAACIRVTVLFGQFPARPRWLFAAVAYLCVALVMQPSVYTFVWWETDWSGLEELHDADGRPSFDAEATMYAQATRIAEAAAALADERPGTPDLYFVGFAADASQSVFLREVRYAADLFERRFDARGRTLALVNHEETVEELPLATVTNLELALAAVAKRMNPEEDVLFLFLTGHGSSDHELAIQFEPLPLNRLGPERIAAAIEAAGIRYRVIVVSACYSGGFVAPLVDENSMVLTAAASDRKSFGCSEEAEFTYFGRAFFGEALEQTTSFEVAFQMARAAIDERERAEGQTPSHPQIHKGERIARHLEELRRDWPDRTAPVLAEAR